jgi:hypothetical protein
MQGLAKATSRDEEKVMATLENVLRTKKMMSMKPTSQGALVQKRHHFI